jgi:hypothetical protein
MSFLIKNYTIHPGVCIYRTASNASANLSFVGGTFQALSGNNTATLYFEGGFRYYFEDNFASSNTSNTSGTASLSVTRLFGSQNYTEQLFTRNGGSSTNVQKWVGSLIADAVSDISVTYTAAGSPRSPSAQLVIWRVPL